jgi:hypothetical protein
VSPDKETHRADRIELYADWLAHDADGLAFNIAHPADTPIPNATTTLANARAKLAWALEQLDQAIAADSRAHASEQEIA